MLLQTSIGGLTIVRELFNQVEMYDDAPLGCSEISFHMCGGTTLTVGWEPPLPTDEKLRR